VLELTVADHQRPHRLTGQALLFDMDGTLVDSRSCVERTWRAWCARHGLDSAELLRLSHGRQNHDTIRLVAPHLDTADEIAWLMKAEENCREGVVEVLGAKRVLAGLPPGCWAVVTSAWRRLAEIRLHCAELPRPRVLVAADEIRRGKPDPEGYLRAAQRLRVDPAACIVVEDAPVGVEAARAAGMSVIGITTTFRPAALDCEWCIDDFEGVRIRLL
jgi:sugar-phosphatase